VLPNFLAIVVVCYRVLTFAQLTGEQTIVLSPFTTPVTHLQDHRVKSVQ